MDFFDYVKSRSKSCSDDVKSDFIEDANRDPGFPRVKNLKELKRYIQSKTLNPDVWEAAKLVWNDYQMES